jgi:hypothetical protein
VATTSVITSKPANGGEPEQHLVIACQRPRWQEGSKFVWRRVQFDLEKILARKR